MGKWLAFFLIFFIACTAPVQEKPQVKCPDGTFVEDVAKCPKPAEEPSPTPEIKAPVQTVKPVPVKPVEKTVMQELLEKTPDVYMFFDGTYKVIVAGKKRSTGEYDPYWNYLYRLMYWDTDTKVLYVLAPYHVAESWWLEHQGKNASRTLGASKYLPAFFKLELTGDKEIDKTRIPKEFNKYWFDAKESELIRLIKEFYVKGPVDWMKDYKDDTPLKIVTAPQMVPWGETRVQSKLILHYKNHEKSDWTTVFYIIEDYNIPVIIEYRDEKGLIAKSMKFDFYTDYVKQGKNNIPLTEKIVELPEGNIVVSVQEFYEWMED